ncbi:LytR/AlgR family response regulator transcription factor [Algoriphagus hitonicola]|uniref:Two component transcriptional regulator, LytTR family n=1 Tax=Algoriphagus hitonicola TaxID=435880 RepID=A0A1I2Q8T6_9BACT|nr:LytTR family DNA-binding domain-containing protein [Algoriphagus hitonicola]SFG24905.1 two component transcriptional regulator, LytTR family [Algoriphagus hitonicola]
MTSILIIEDEKPAADRLLQLIKPHFDDVNFIKPIDSIVAAVDYFMTYPHPDLIFCDIQLADGLSFEIFRKVKLSTPIIFTTAFDQYAIEAFRVNAVDYLLKPIDPVDLKRAVDKYKSQQMPPSLSPVLIEKLLRIAPSGNEFKKRFLVRFGEKIQSISSDDIYFFYSEERVTFLVTTKGKKYVLDQTLEKTEYQLDPHVFFRLNRKYIASFHSIEEVITYSNSRLKVKLKSCEDSEILVSREKVSDLKAWFDQ